jgi:eukaryotic-like serine/threonine-protein kinase
MIAQQVSHYRILEQIGEGGMGVVFKAEDLKLGRQVALKFLPEQLSTDRTALGRFQREARLASALNHPNICTIYEIDSYEEGRYFIAMELLEGETLKQRIGGRMLPTKQVLEFGMQIADALRVAHAKGIIHRDIKPGNVFVTESGAKVLDFGLAKIMLQATDTTASLTLTETQVVGTLPYMAPEQLRGEKVDERADIYALGAVLYEMATGRRPFCEPVATRLVDDILHKLPSSPVKWNAGVSAQLEAIILKCLEKDPENRYQSAKELLVDLRRLAGSSVSVPQIRETHPRGRLFWRFGVPALVVAVAIPAFVVGLNVDGVRDRLLGRAGQPKIESLAVLPLANLSGDPEQEYFADGMTEALITELSKIRALKVISRTSAMQYKGAKKSLPQIARELGVEGAIEGSVMREGNQVRITIDLVDGPTDKHLWGERYERELKGILALQSDVARAVADRIKVEITPEERTRLRTTPAVNPDAYDAYLRGRFFWNKRSKEALRKSIEYFNEAIRLDPRYAAPYSGLADAYDFAACGFPGGIAMAEAEPRAKAAALRAVELDDTSAEAHAALGFVRWCFDRDLSAESELRRAIALNPNYATAHHQYGVFLLLNWRYDESFDQLQQALRLDPVSPNINGMLGWYLFYTREFEKAVDQFHKTLELDSGQYNNRVRLGFVYAVVKRYADAESQFRKAEEISQGSLTSLGGLAYVYGLEGKKKDAEHMLPEVETLAKEEGHLWALALVHVGLRNEDEAVRWLERAYEQKDSNFVLQSPLWDLLRSDPRFQELERHAKAGYTALTSK